MASNAFSRLLPQGRGRSFYEELRGRDSAADIEGGAGIDIDQENLNRPFQDYDLDEAERLAAEGSRISMSPSDAGPSTQHGFHDRSTTAASRWMAGVPEDDVDNDVPESLLVEAPQGPAQKQPPASNREQARQPAVPGPSSRKTRGQWEATQNQQRLHVDDGHPRGSGPGRPGQPAPPITADRVAGSPRERAMWRWVNVSNLDKFTTNVYHYYQASGFWCIILDVVLELVNATFVVVFLTFLTQCVDYRKIPQSKELSEVTIPQCTQKMGTVWNLGLWLFAVWIVFRGISLILSLGQLRLLREFYTHLLNIPEDDMQSVSWQDVVARMMALRDSHPKTATNLTGVQRAWVGSQSKERLDAHDICNRIMRRENFLIALLNKDVLDLTIPLPFLRKRQHMSQCIKFAIEFSILDFVFDANGQVNEEFLRAGRRGQLSQKLRTRFAFAGFMVLVSAPFIALYLIVVYFLMYFHEFRSDPSAIGARAYTSLALWKFREFNELEHLFNARLKMSQPFAKVYIDQFPKRKTEQVARTISFIAGSIVAVLAVATLFDSEMFLSFEITPDRTAVFYIGVLGAVWAAARGNVSDENEVYDPEYAMKSVIGYTHYEPDHWQDRLHSTEVKTEFAELYKPKPLIFLEEIISILLTPLVLLISLPKTSDQIIDFFREFTIHVDGLGYVCSFAVFDFKKGVENQKQPAADMRDGYYSTKHGKMAASFYGFLDNYVINPKTGLPGSHQHGSRHQFQPHPSFPGLYSPTLAADMQQSRIAGRERGRGSGGRAQASGVQAAARAPHFRSAMPQPSPMASVLLDPHNQPAASAFGNMSLTRPRHQQRGGYPGDRNIIQEAAAEDGREDSQVGKPGDVDVYESGGDLDESTWQTSPTKALSRENSTAKGQEPDVGVLGLMYEFQQARMRR
ncbi:hypothetical protein RB601_005664 [Gaeumannomyces tritici]